MMIDWPSAGRLIEMLVPSLTVKRTVAGVRAAVAVVRFSGAMPNTSAAMPTTTAPPAMIPDNGRVAFPDCLVSHWFNLLCWLYREEKVLWRCSRLYAGCVLCGLRTTCTSEGAMHL
jgi:hypothetical protein